MNDPEVTMLDAIDNRGLMAHRKALEAAGATISLVMRLSAPLKPIADILIRSARPVPANLAEGRVGPVETVRTSGGSRMPRPRRSTPTCGSSPPQEP